MTPFALLTRPYSFIPSRNFCRPDMPACEAGEGNMYLREIRYA